MKPLNNKPIFLSNERYGGIDGCRGGWFCIWTKDRRFFAFELLSKLDDIMEYKKNAKNIFIDIPIGLPDKGRRVCDYEARRLLGPRASTVFFAPVLKTMNSRTYEEACRVNKEKAGKKISIQVWNLMPKIRETDRFLKIYPEMRKIFRESHPELCFQGLRAGKTIKESKKTAEGIQKRMECLCRIAPVAEHVLQEARQQYSKNLLQTDDIIDAMVLCISASLPAKNLISVPEKAEKNFKNQRMEIVFNKSYLCL